MSVIAIAGAGGGLGPVVVKRLKDDGHTVAGIDRNVDAELTHVQVHGAGGLEAVEHDDRAMGVRDADNTRDIEPGAGAIADVGDGDDAGGIVDRGFEVGEGYKTSGILLDVHDAGAAGGLRMPDLAAGGVFVVADDNLVAAAVESDSAGD